MSTASESGTYFKKIYNDLVERGREFPTGDPSPNLQECIGITKPDYVNFVRAEMLARQHNLSSDIITHLREMAILQYLIDYKNPEGLQELREEFGLTQGKAARIIKLILQEREYPCYMFSKATKMAIDENWSQMWREVYTPILEKASGKPSVLSRFVAWIRRFFGGNRMP